MQKRFKPFVEDKLASLITNRAIVAHPYSALSFAQYIQQPLAKPKAAHESTLPSMVFIGAEGAGLIMRLSCLLSKDVRQLISGRASYVPKRRSMLFWDNGC